jgi:hypothetical protein
LNDAVGVHDKIKKAFQDIVAPELHALRCRLTAKGELIAEIRRLDTRIDGLDRELRTAIDIRECLAVLEARRS